MQDGKSETERNDKRMLVAIYRLTRGRTGVDISEQDVIAELASEEVFAMTDEEFDAYHQRVLEEVKATWS